MKTRHAALLWSIPAALFAGDALAWGLYTHVYFAQLLVWAVPLIDPALRRAVRRFPQRLVAGACLPDLALVGTTAGTRAFDASHRWETAHAPLDRFSFPSGHTLHAVVFSLVATAYYPALGWLVWPFTALVALSRLVLGLHYVSDVLVGALLGASIALAGLAF